MKQGPDLDHPNSKFCGLIGFVILEKLGDRKLGGVTLRSIYFPSVWVNEK